MVIDPGVVQFLSETIRLISNRTHAAHKFNFEITHMTQTELHSIRLPLPSGVHSLFLLKITPEII